MSANQLVKYDAMCRAIAAAHKVDEVKDLRDKAKAIEAYSRQAQNTEAEQQACEIRLRAERKCGQLLRKIEKAKGAREPGTQRGATRSDNATASLAQLKISKQQSADWQQLAAVPDDLFEQALANGRATTAGIIAAAKPKDALDAVDEKAFWFWGRLQDLQRHGVFEEDPAHICDTMLPHMRAALRELIPQVINWLKGVAP